jgi:hypothetical protein
VRVGLASVGEAPGLRYQRVAMELVATRGAPSMLSARSPPDGSPQGHREPSSGLIRGFGLRLQGRWDAGVREAVAGHPSLLQILDPFLIARRVLREQLIVLDTPVVLILDGATSMKPNAASG